MWKFRELSDKVTNVVMNYSEVEAKVREATNDDTWGPHGSIMQDIAKNTFTYEGFPEVMAMLWQRMFDKTKNWRRTYKSLLLLAYLVRNGSERVVTSARDHMYDLKALEDYQYKDENLKDQGINVRQKVKELIALLQDNSRLRDERRKAKKTKDKYVGVSSEQTTTRYSDRYDADPRASSYDEGEGRVKSSSKNAYKDDSDSEHDEGAGISMPSGTIGTPTTSKKTAKKSRAPIDLGAAAHYTGTGPESTNSSAAAGTSSGGDLFADFSSAPAANTNKTVSQVTLQSVAPHVDAFGAAPSASAAPANQDFGDFAAFSSAPAPAAAAPAPAASSQGFADFTGFQGATPAPTQQPAVAAAPAPLSAMDLMNAQPSLMQPQATTAQTMQPAASAATTTSAQADLKSSSELSKWTDSTGLNVSLDLSASSAQKKAQSNQPSMNQMQQRKPVAPAAGSTIQAGGMMGGGMQAQQQQQAAMMGGMQGGMQGGMGGMQGMRMQGGGMMGAGMGMGGMQPAAAGMGAAGMQGMAMQQGMGMQQPV
eukprot:scpid75088/ scgid23429/ Clathrin interactor 1; Epsin-4